MKRNTVFVIEEGEYLDYHVVGLFSTKENAQFIYDLLKSGEYSGGLHEIAEWEIDPSVDELRKGYRPFYVVMLKDGTVETCDKRDISSYNFRISPNFFLWKRTEAPAYKGKGIPDALSCDVFAKNEKHAVKIANEHRAKMIANGEW